MDSPRSSVSSASMYRELDDDFDRRWACGIEDVNTLFGSSRGDDQQQFSMPGSGQALSTDDYTPMQWEMSNSSSSDVEKSDVQEAAVPPAHPPQKASLSRLEVLRQHRQQRLQQQHQQHQQQEAEAVQASQLEAPTPKPSSVGACRVQVKECASQRIFEGVSHWHGRVAQALAAAGVDLTRTPSRPVVCEALCAGTAGEWVGLELFGVHKHVKFQAAADTSKISRMFLHHTWPRLEHLFEANDALVDLDDGHVSSEFFCAQCGKKCGSRLECADISSGGFPCTPFSRLRTKSGDTPGTLATEDHPALGTLMQGLPKYLEDRRPGCFWFEEVVDMSTRINHDTGATFLHGLVDVCASLDYSIRAFVMNHSLFVA